MIKALAQHYDAIAPKRERYLAGNSYYYSLLYKEYRYLVPPNRKILEVGCGTGDLLNALTPSLGVGIDISPGMIKIASQKFPHLKFDVGEIKDLPVNEKFDYIILSGLLGELADIQGLFEQLKKFCHPHTRVIIEYYSYFWQYFLKFGEKLHLKMPQRLQNWITYNDVGNFLALSGYEPIKVERSILFP